MRSALPVLLASVLSPARLAAILAPALLGTTPGDVAGPDAGVVGVSRSRLPRSPRPDAGAAPVGRGLRDAETAPLEITAGLAQRPGAIAVTSTGRAFVAMHPLGLPELKLVELRQGRVEPYPSGVLARGFGAVTALAVGARGALWILDAGAERVPPALLGWNTVDERRILGIRLPPEVLTPASALVGLVVDEGRHLAVVADRSRADWTGDSHPALVVVDLSTGRARRVLEDHPALEPDAVPLVIDRHTLARRGPDGTVERLRLGASALARDPSGTWLYLAPLTSGTLWRVRLADLADPLLTPAELAERVESHADRPPGTGLLAADDGRCIVGDPARHALVSVAPAGVAVLVQDDRLSWPESLAEGPDGWIWVTASQLHLHPAMNRGVEQGRPPYLVLRVRAPTVAPRVVPVPEPISQDDDTP